mgnify:FL=1
MYIGASSMIANQQRLEVISNNLANVNTTGYKKDYALFESFPEKLLYKINARVNNNQQQPNQFTFQQDGQTYTATTNNGYFVISSPFGLSYVKEIRFTIDDEGYLKTFYRDGTDQLKTDNECYVCDRQGNPLQGAGNLEQILQQNIYYPASNVIGTMSAGVNFQKIVTDFTLGELTETGGKLDVALNRSGFFTVVDGEGNTYYTRDGSFQLNEEGALVTSTGHYVQGTNGNIYINGDDISIGRDGTVIVDGNVVGRLDIVDLQNREFLRKVGYNLYQMAEGAEPEEIAYEGEVLQGVIEGSNVNPIDEMVEMITLLREFEVSQKLIRVQDEMLERASNELGRI